MSAMDTFGYERMDPTFGDDLAKMVTVTESGTGGGYEWDEFVAYWHPEKRRYFYVSDSGCSCDSISMGVSGLGDFESVQTKGELVEALKREKNKWSTSDKLDVTKEIQNFKEA